MIRLSVTELESFRFWKGREDATVDDLLAELRHTKPPTHQMEAGRAWAKFWEMGANAGTGKATVEGWTFDFTDVDAQVVLPEWREVKAEVPMETPSGPVMLVGKADGIGGHYVCDQKLTERFDAEKYIDSLQWRCYLAMFKAHEFRYDVFEGKYDLSGRWPDQRLNSKDVVITDYHPMSFYWYPKVQEDVQKAVNELASVIKRYLPERVTP